MARADQEAIDTFMSFTGVSEAVAIQKLEEHHGNLNGAVNAHFSQVDRSSRAREALFTDPCDDVMDIDYAMQGEPRRRPSLRHPFTGDFNPFAFPHLNFNRSIVDSGASIMSRSLFIPHRRDVGEIPVEVKDGAGAGASCRTGSAPVIEDVSETAHDHGPEISGTVTLGGSDDGRSITNAQIMQTGMNADQGSTLQTRSGAPTIVDLPHYNNNDIEEEMVRAAIEASKQDLRYDHLDLGNPAPLPLQSHVEDAGLAHAVSLSLQTAERENALREQKGEVGVSELDTRISAPPEVMRKIASSNGRQSQLDHGSSSALEESEDVEQFRHRRRRVTSNSIDTPQNNGVEISSPSSLPQNDNAQHLQPNGSNFPSDVWGGITPEEHDEAVMLEAAMFGGVPEGSECHFPNAPQQLMQNGFNRSFGSFPSPRPHCPSPSLTAQRLIQEQQDDEYLASIQADREKELKAKQEAKAALAEEKFKEEEFHKQLQQEEEIERQLEAKEASIPQEPTPDDEGAVTLLVRLPDGSRRGRRFRKSDKLQHLFDFIDVSRSIKPGSYRLVRPYPRCAFGDRELPLNLDELGLTSKQETLYLESI